MEKKCKQLYDAICHAYESKDIRDNQRLSQILLSASNEVIKTGDASQAAVRLDRQLNIYRLETGFSLPRELAALKQLTQTVADDFQDEDSLFHRLSRIFGKQ